MSELYYYEEWNEYAWNNERHRWFYLVKVDAYCWIRISNYSVDSILLFDIRLLEKDANWVRLL